MGTPVAVLTGHCVDGQDDRYHRLCPVRWRTPFGVEQYCPCPNHDDEGDQ